VPRGVSGSCVEPRQPLTVSAERRQWPDDPGADARGLPVLAKVAGTFIGPTAFGCQAARSRDPERAKYGRRRARGAPVAPQGRGRPPCRPCARGKTSVGQGVSLLCGPLVSLAEF
jgi:hypothetical protein